MTITKRLIASANKDQELAQFDQLKRMMLNADDDTLCKLVALHGEGVYEAHNFRNALQEIVDTGDVDYVLVSEDNKHAFFMTVDELSKEIRDNCASYAADVFKRFTPAELADQLGLKTD